MRSKILKAFDAQTPEEWRRWLAEYRRTYIGWIDSAKQQRTKTRRLEEAVRLLSAGKKLGLK
ncbi:MAG: YdeI/OmpD-associated family protein [Terriglobia bacterium]